MKLNKFANVLVIGLVLTIAASGCRKKPVNTTVIPGAKTTNVADTDTAKPLTSGEKGTGGVDSVNSNDPHSSNPTDIHNGWLKDPIILKADTVFFAFDSSVIKTEEKPKVSAVADYLKANSAAAVLVEGNCDARGTEEYNRSLGERRALAVREELIRLGIDPTRVDTISYGKDKPASQGNDESAWKLNRRDDFVVLTAPPK